jgi:hypothetical protein
LLGASFSGKSANYPVGYSTFGSTCTGRGIAVDSSKNIYITGNYSSATTVPIRTFGATPTASGVSLPITTGTDMFVIKWLANGTLAGYSTINGTGSDSGYDIAVDSSQNIYITGSYSTATSAIPINTFGTAPTFSGLTLPITLGLDAFVIKWLANGTVAGYTYLRGTGTATDQGQSIAVDSSQNIYVTGQYNSAGTGPINTFGTGPTASGVSMPGTTGTDAFVIKWNAAGGTLAGYSRINGNGTDIGYGVAFDSSSNIYVTGNYISTVIVPINTFGTAPVASGVSMPVSVNDAFVIKWNA